MQHSTQSDLKPETAGLARVATKSVQTWSKALRAAISVARHRPLVVHQRRYTRELPDDVLFAIFCRQYRRKLRKPKDLAMIQIHNRPYKTLLERNLDYLGIEEYSVLNVKCAEWRNTMKITEALIFASRCRDEYIFFCDSDDAILTDDPQKAIDLLRESRCDMLISATNFRGEFYRVMPERESWAAEVAREQGHSTDAIHLNAGVYVARTEFLVEVLTEAAKFVSDSSTNPGAIGSQYGRPAAPSYPRGSRSDQQILRYLHPSFYPRMKIDYSLRLAVRNP